MARLIRNDADEFGTHHGHQASIEYAKVCMSMRLGNARYSACASAYKVFSDLRSGALVLGAVAALFALATSYAGDSRDCWGGAPDLALVAWRLVWGGRSHIARCQASPAPNGHCILCGPVRPTTEGASAFPSKRQVTHTGHYGIMPMVDDTCVRAQMERARH